MKRKLLQFGVLTIAAFCLVASPLTPLVSAQSSTNTTNRCDKAFYSASDILYYDPCSTSTTCTSGQSNVSSTTKLEKTDTINAIWTYLTTTPLSTNGNKPLTPAQAAGVMGNMDAESSFNPSAIESTSRAEKGHGLVQWTFGRWSGADGLEKFAASQGKAWDDLTTQLNFLKKELEGSEQGVLKDPQFAATTDPAVAAAQWRIVFERADPAMAHDERRIGSAVAIFNLFGGTAASCQTTSAAVSGNFMQTAINFALTTYATTGMTKETDARDTYQAAFKKYNTDSQDWTDCGRFVATSLYASGVDTSYPKVNVATQLAYVQAHPEKYTIITAPKLADLQPGDILFVTGHTAIYTGASQFPIVDASLGDHIPSVRGSANLQSMLNDGSLVAARLNK